MADYQLIVPKEKLLLFPDIQIVNTVFTILVGRSQVYDLYANRRRTAQ